MIDYATFCKWMRSEREDHAAFRDAVLAAEAEHEAKVLSQWEAMNEKMVTGGTKADWRSQQALLTYRHKWQPPATETRTHITQDVNVTIGPDLTRLDESELQQLSSLLDKTRQLQIEDGSIVDAEFEDSPNTTVA